MKTRLTFIAALVFILGSCTTGSYVTSTYPDDIYFNPADIPPPITITETVIEEPIQEKSGERLIISQIDDNEDGSNTMNNYIFDGTEEDADALIYNMDQMELDGSDTTIYYNDDELKYVINNYYDGDELDYAYRIRRFHNPYYYDPFYWDSWAYDPYFGYGYASMYNPYYSYGWGYGSSWYSPYSRWGFSPYYSNYYSPYYYGGYYGKFQNTLWEK